MTGSSNLISRAYFNNPEVFDGSLVDNEAVNTFLPLDSAELFAQVQP